MSRPPWCRTTSRTPSAAPSTTGLAPSRPMCGSVPSCRGSAATSWPTGRVACTPWWTATSTQVGQLAETDRGRLVSDDDVVAWVDAAGAGTLSVLDLATGDRVDVPVAELPGEPVSETTPDGSAESAPTSRPWTDGPSTSPTPRGVMAWNALDGEDPVLLAAPDGVEVQVLDVRDGQILQVARAFEPRETDGSTTMVQVEELRIGPDLQDTRSLPGTGGRLSPDGRRAALYDLRVAPPRPPRPTTRPWSATSPETAGRSVAPRGYDSVTAYRWLDADTFAVGAGSYTADSARRGPALVRGEHGRLHRGAARGPGGSGGPHGTDDALRVRDDAGQIRGLSARSACSARASRLWVRP